MKRELTVLSCLLILAIVVVSLLIYSPQYEPDDGIWFCEELRIQLDYGGSGETFILENEEKIQCSCGSDRGVKEIYVSCQERDHPTYKMGELVFCAEITKLTDNALTVFDPLTDQEYIFVRVN